MSTPKRKIQYRFVFKDGKEESFTVFLDPETLAYQPDDKALPPSWAHLENKKCSNCPLQSPEHHYCPVAKNLAPVLTRFVDRISYEVVDVIITTEARDVRKRVSLQKAISALFGLIMATSGCPSLDKLRPMAYTHLPLAELDETRYRALSMYLLAQYFRARKGLPADWGLKGLEEVYSDINTVNHDFIERLRTIDMQDANLNAIINLDCFCLGSDAIINKSLNKLESIFDAYF